ncbi:MAG: hypothetical protein RL189_879 [Pseudomonadota bacterium]|jgi:protein required for attachment to host cells
MKKIAVLTIDLSKAKLFVLRPAERPSEQWSPVLKCEETLPNTHWINQKNETLSGGNRFSYHVGLSGMAQTMHGYDDHLERHQKEISKRFARDVAGVLSDFVAQHKTTELVIVAESKILGDLRAQIGKELRQLVNILELGMNLSNLSATDLHNHLAGLAALPRRSAPVDTQGESHARSGQWRRRGLPSQGKEEGAAASSEPI